MCQVCKPKAVQQGQRLQKWGLQLGRLRGRQLYRAYNKTGHTSDLCGSSFKQSKWTTAYVSGGCGDISFGTADNSGPTISWNRVQSTAKNCNACNFSWPAGNKVYSIGKSTKSFRIGWGECGPQHEGWYPWYSGYVMLR